MGNTRDMAIYNWEHAITKASNCISVTNAALPYTNFKVRQGAN